MQVPEQFWNKFKNKELKMYNRDAKNEDTLFTKTALAMCENIDWNVGRISKKIEELGLSKKTIILYFSDNGPNGIRWNDGMKGKKGSTDDGGVRSPLIMKWDGTFKAGKKIKQIASGIDLLPTLADLTDIKMNTLHPLDGLSLKSLLLEENPQWNDRFIYNYWNEKTSVRNQKFRLDANNKLFDMETDPGQHTDVSGKFPEIYAEMLAAKNRWEKEVASELKKTERPFTIGAPGYSFTQLPARDGIAHGNIVRSNKWPNSSYYLNWISTSDSITWPAEVLADGLFEVELYYTCPEKDKGSTLELSFNNSKIEFQLNEAFDSPLLTENDIYPRWEGYVKKFHHVNMGTIELNKGLGTLTLKATKIPGSQVMDFRLLNLKKQK
jgi:hypothetical protein